MYHPADMLNAAVTYVDPKKGPRSLQAVGEDRGVALPGTSTEFRFSAAVAEFGLLLRDSDYKGNATYKGVLHHAVQSAGPDYAGYRQEFVGLIRKAAGFCSVLRLIFHSQSNSSCCGKRAVRALRRPLALESRINPLNHRRRNRPLMEHGHQLGVFGIKAFARCVAGFSRTSHGVCCEKGDNANAFSSSIRLGRFASDESRSM